MCIRQEIKKYFKKYPIYEYQRLRNFKEEFPSLYKKLTTPNGNFSIDSNEYHYTIQNMGSLTYIRITKDQEKKEENPIGDEIYINSNPHYSKGRLDKMKANMDSIAWKDVLKNWPEQAFGTKLKEKSEE